MGFAALITLAAAQAVAGAASTTVSFDTEQYDDNGYYNPAAPTKLTVPAGVSRVRVGGCAQFDQVDSGLNVRTSIMKNGQLVYPGCVFQTSADPGSSQEPRANVASGQIPVQQGDYFEMSVQIGGETTGYNVLGSHRTSLWIEAA